MLFGFVTSCVATAFRNTLLKGREDEEEDVSSYWVAFTYNKKEEG
jgi:hypothetical protein